VLPRFKQIKEQEARRRQQREAEQRKAEQATANVTQMTNGGLKKEANSVQRESGSGAESRDSRNGSGNSMTGITNLSNTRHHDVNGELSTVESKEDGSTSILDVESVDHSVKLEHERGDQNPQEPPEKVAS